MLTTSWSLQQEASPIAPPIEGKDLKNIFFMRTPQDAEDLRKAVESGGIKRAVIAGGGFIGLEVAENLMNRGVRTTVIDMAPHIMPGFDPEMAGVCGRLSGRQRHHGYD